MHHTKEIFNFVKCQHCGLVMLNPRVGPAGLQRYYTQYYLPFRGPSAWGKYKHLVESNLGKTDKKRVNVTVKTTDISKSSRVLDVGCGKPTFLKRLNDITGCYALGTDFTDEGWNRDTDRFQNIHLMVSEIDKLKPDKPFDAITMWHYLEHDYHPGNTLQYLANVSHKGTKLIIEVPNFNSWTRKVQGRFWEGYHTPRHTALYSPRNISILLERNGWQVEAIKTYGTLDPYPLFWMGIQERFGTDWGRSMQKKFVGYVAGMVLTFPLFALQKWLPAGIMLVIARLSRGR